jgi:hypothetical protein
MFEASALTGLFDIIELAMHRYGSFAGNGDEAL